jgi:hypothetical protein
MRATLLAFAIILAACGPAVAPKPPSFDEDFATDRTPTDVAVGPTVAASTAKPRPDAPAGKGARTGTIDRAHLVAVLDGGPGAFLRQFEVSARLDGERFVGWQLVQVLDRAGPLADVDVAPGDVLFAINGKPLGKPEQLQAVWDSLRTANQIVAQLSRGAAKVELVFEVEPKL